MSDKPNLLECSDPEAIHQALIRSYQPYGKICRVQLFCHDGKPDKIMSTIRMREGTERAARAGGGVVLAGAIHRIDALPAGFHCRFRKGPALQVRSCDECNWFDTSRQTGHGHFPPDGQIN